MVNAIILAGGLGTRLAAVVSHLPKTLAPIKGTPFLQLLLNKLQQSGIVSKVILALGHKASDVQTFAKRQSTTLHLEFSIEPSPLGTGGAILHALSKTDSDTLLVLNGDSYFDLELSSFLYFHLQHQADVSIACTYVTDTSRYGSIDFNAASHITQFCEKSSSLKAGWINAGVYLMQRKVFQNMISSACSLENDLFPLFLQKKLFAYCHQGTFIDIGLPSSYNQAQKILEPWISQ